ncbi:MAG: hypothetical protein ACW98U_13140 [Candidatus Thorarchaeota archaeon]|jgi:hypothetical protein
MVDEDFDSEEMADELIDAIDDEADSGAVDGLTKKERDIEAGRESERQRKAKELKKQLRKRQLGLINYRWPAIVLILGGVMAISTEFLTVMFRDPIEIPPEVGFDTFVEAFSRTGGIIYLFPIIAGALMIVLSYFAYSNPRATWLAIIPALLLFMSGGTVYFLVTFAVTLQPLYVDFIYATPVTLTMMLAGIVSLLAIAMRERE